jgi:hypothetical protein
MPSESLKYLATQLHLASGRLQVCVQESKWLDASGEARTALTFASKLFTRLSALEEALEVLKDD